MYTPFLNKTSFKEKGPKMQKNYYQLEVPVKQSRQQTQSEKKNSVVSEKHQYYPFKKVKGLIA